MNDFTILHLSDLHISQEGSLLSLLMENLLKDIKKEMKLVEDIIIVVTGDLVHKGNYKYKSGVLEFFRGLKEAIGRNVRDIYIVPGNHDKVRNKLDSKILEEYDFSDKDTNKFYTDYWKYISLSFREYQDMVKDIYSIFDKKEDDKLKENIYGVSVTNINNKKICFLLLNTAWSCTGDKDERHLKFGKFQLDTIKNEYNKYIKEGCDLVIALAHHPLNWLEGEEETLLQSNILSNYSLNCNIYISGHIHNRDIINWQSTRHSLTTLVSGLGWPDEEDDMQHPYAHTYSSYTFNLDINSIDVYVRSSDDNSVFEPDFRIYTNRRKKMNNKIVMPLDSNKTQAYFNLGTIKGRSPKSYYITEDVLNMIQIYVSMIGKFRKKMYIELNNLKKDFLDQLDGNISACNSELLLEKKNDTQKKKLEKEIEKNFQIYDELDSCFFRGMELDKNAQQYLDENQEIIGNQFIAYLQSLCSTLNKLLEESLKDIIPVDKKISGTKDGFSSRTVRVHFRAYNVEKDWYEQLCIGDSSIWAEYEMKKQKWGELLKESYIANHSLVASINKRYCEESYSQNKKKKNDKRDYKWTDFLTSIPRFLQNRYIKYDARTQNILKERPWLTFGITVYDQRSSKMLYILDYLDINAVISDCIIEFYSYMPIHIGSFIEKNLGIKWE